MIDLHCHSNFSDGELSPQTLIAKAISEDIKILALTDHDTVAGLKELQQVAASYPIHIINGIELSTRWKKYDIHVLGLNIDPEHEIMQELIAKQNTNRINRALQISAKLKSCGIDDAYTKACKIAGHNRVGRPHFAQVCIAEGLVVDMKTAFKRYLARGKSAYVPTPWISIAEAVEGIIQAKGEAVLAHPLKYSLTNTKLHELIVEFKKVGGKGIEVVSGEITTAQIETMVGLCSRYELLASTGSDYHGDNLSRISLGRQRQLPLNCIPIWHQWIN